MRTMARVYTRRMPGICVSVSRWHIREPALYIKNYGMLFYTARRLLRYATSRQTACRKHAASVNSYAPRDGVEYGARRTPNTPAPITLPASQTAQPVRQTANAVSLREAASATPASADTPCAAASHGTVLNRRRRRICCKTVMRQRHGTAS